MGERICTSLVFGTIVKLTIYIGGRIVFGSDDIIIDLLIRSYKTKGKVRSSPAIFNEATAVMGSADGNLYFFNYMNIFVE